MEVKVLWGFWRDHYRVLPRVFDLLVRCAAEAELVGMDLHALEGTKIRAASSMHTAVHRQDARVMKCDPRSLLAYNGQAVVDHESDLIVAIGRCAEAEETDHDQLVPMMEETKRLLGAVAKALFNPGRAYYADVRCFCAFFFSCSSRSSTVSYQRSIRRACRGGSTVA